MPLLLLKGVWKILTQYSNVKVILGCMQTSLRSIHQICTSTTVCLLTFFLYWSFFMTVSFLVLHIHPFTSLTTFFRLILNFCCLFINLASSDTGSPVFSFLNLCSTWIWLLYFVSLIYIPLNITSGILALKFRCWWRKWWLRILWLYYVSSKSGHFWVRMSVLN